MAIAETLNIIVEILEDKTYDNELNDACRYEKILEVEIIKSWNEILDCIYILLLDKKYNIYWHDLITVLFVSASDGKYFSNINKAIAILYKCLEFDQNLDENLIWSTVISLKKINYLSDYEPLKDADVLNELKNIVLT